MRDADLDWEIYHVLVDGRIRTASGLAECGYDSAAVEASLRRLERALLIERRGDEVRTLSFRESLLLCQLKNDDTSPFCLDDGIIRAKTSEERKGT
ncbi:MAG: MarR family transcriptional regulator [Methanomicrobiales archaeon]|nr:MarR family transcriptional regulator [Methanomicrobiales archaeon]